VPSFTREQEVAMLEQQEKAVKIQLDAINKRLTELSKQDDIDSQ
jgi:hypothetical protein